MGTEEIWQSHREKLQRFIQKRISNPASADDILQDVFVRIHSHIDTLRDDAKLDNWVYQIARNAVIDHYRGRRKMEVLPPCLREADRDHSAATRDEIKSLLVPLIQNLPALYRDTVLLSEIVGLTQKEVAVRQRLSLSGVKSRVQRGRAMLRSLLMQRCRFEFDMQGRVFDCEAREVECGC